MSTIAHQVTVGSQQKLEADVAIIGLGPVGLMLSILLGKKGYSVVGVDRWPTPYPLARAVTFDHEIARILDSLGIDSDNDPAIDYHDSIYRWLTADHETLMEVDWISKAQDGWRNRYWFSQPALEDRFRQILDSLPNVKTFAGVEINSLTQNENSVTLKGIQVTAANGTTTPVTDGGTLTIEAKFVVGSDGANSFVRRTLGLEMTDLQFYYDWLVVDMHPHIKQTYTPAHYQICDPVRPTTVVPGGPDKRRWEFMALPGESKEELGTPEKTWELLEPFGLNPQNSTLERAVVWRFQAKYLEEWRVGRVALAGDAAHLMPPFAGEGMCSGIRDAVNLSWKLDLILQNQAKIDLLDAYTSERKPHIKWYINFSVELGKVICVTDPEEAAKRDRDLIAAHEIQKKIGPISPHQAVLGDGIWSASDKEAGLPAIQGRVAYKGMAGRFDTVATRGWSLISLHESGEELSSEDAKTFEKIGGKQFKVGLQGSGAELIDTDGTYTNWLKLKGATHLLVRPDFYVGFVAIDQSDLNTKIREIFNLMHLSQRA